MIANVLNPYSTKSRNLVESLVMRYNDHNQIFFLRTDFFCPLGGSLAEGGYMLSSQQYFENNSPLNDIKTLKHSNQYFIFSVTYHAYSRRKIYSSRLQVTKKYTKLIKVISSNLYCESNREYTDKSLTFK